MAAPKIGLLALQGAIGLHAEALRSLGAEAVPVRTAEQLAGVEALLESSGLAEPLAERLACGMPAFGTCAGMILLAADVADGRPDQRAFGAIDIGVRRNAFGRQIDSFEADLVVPVLEGGLFHAVFIRAPVVERVGEGVEVLATVDDRPVLCRQGRVFVSAFHPELTPDLRLHRMFLEDIDVGS
jgi:pyridoxal 5'-phosphate synthase pdxT subunit